MSFRSRFWVGVAFAGWLAVAASGFALLGRYKGTPGVEGTAPRDWPASSTLHRPDSNVHLVLFAHPRCPCTRAAVTELARIVARSQNRLEADVLFFRPEDRAIEWDETALFRSASGIPGVRASWDEGGREARLFGARTSGHAVAFDRGGRLLFSGGITTSRGHEGGNAGSDAVLAFAMGRSGARSAPVYGCPLESSCDSSAKEAR